MSLELQFSSILKQGFRFAVGAALIEAFFWHRGDLLDNFIYPVFGYVSVVIEPTTGGAFTAGLGRIAGSALGGVIAATLVSVFGISGYGLYIIAALTFIIASLICESYRWQAAYSQATLVGTFIAMRALGTSANENIWLYLKSRLIDNWIGICFGVVVALLIYPQDSRSQLNKNLNRFLENISLLTRSICQRYSKAENTTNNSQELIDNLKKLEKSTSATLTKSNTELRNSWLEQWNAINSSQNTLLRQAQDLLKIVDNSKESDLAQSFQPELNSLVNSIGEFCSSLQSGIISRFGPRAEITKIKEKLEHLRISGEIDKFSTFEVLQFFQFSQLLNQFSKELESLQSKINNTDQTKISLSLPKYNKISLRRIVEIIGLGLAIGMSLSIIHHINFPFPSAYQGVADIIIVGSIVMIVQPTKGQAIAVSIAALLSLYLTIFYVYLMAKSFGFNPLTSGIVFFLIYISCSVLGFPPLARIGAIVAADVLGKDIYPFFDQGIVAALVAIPCGIFIALMITKIFMRGSSCDQLESSFSRTFANLGQLYQSLLGKYLNPEYEYENSTSLKNRIAKEIALHPKICKLAGFEKGTGVMAQMRQKQWHLLMNYEQQLFSQLNTLEDELQQPIPEPIVERFLSQLQEIIQQTNEVFADVNIQNQDFKVQSGQIYSLNQKIKTLEQQLLNSRLETKSYKLEQLISFSSTFTTVKEIAENLEQMSQNLELST